MKWHFIYCYRALWDLNRMSFCRPEQHGLQTAAHFWLTVRIVLVVLCSLWQTVGLWDTTGGKSCLHENECVCTHKCDKWREEGSDRDTNTKTGDWGREEKDAPLPARCKGVEFRPWVSLQLMFSGLQSFCTRARQPFLAASSSAASPLSRSCMSVSPSFTMSSGVFPSRFFLVGSAPCWNTFAKVYEWLT